MDISALLLEQAVRCDSEGMAAQAEFLYGKFLAQHPEDAEANHRLGLLLCRSGRTEEGLSRIAQAVTVKPDFADAWHNFGTALANFGRTDEAIPCYQQATALRPESAESWLGLATALAKHARNGEAVEAYRKAAALRPDSPEIFSDMAAAFFHLGRLGEAVDTYQHAVALAPANAIARNNLGLALHAQRRYEEATAEFLQAVAIDPRYEQAHCNLGVSLYALGRADEAAEAYRMAIRIDPGSAAAYTNLSQAFFALGRMEEAIEAARKGIALGSETPEAYNNLGAALHNMRRNEEAIVALEKALSLAPDKPEIHLHYAMALLMLGRMREGWAEYEWRRKIGKFGRSFPAPEWRGEPLDGKTVLLHSEQGLGDALHFARYAPQVAARGGRAMLWVDRPLVRILRTIPGVADVIAAGDPIPPYDCHLPLLSLPFVMGTTLDSIPADVPYLSADPAAAARWRDRLATLPGLKVGLVWSGDPRPHDKEANQVDRRRSLRLEQLAPLAEVGGVTFVSLQKGGPAVQAKTPPAGMALVDWMDEIGDFADTAALVANLDLVISVDTSVVHLVGGLGKPVWILSRFDGCWRWLGEREDSPWYPTAHLFHQTVPGQWDDVVGRVAEDLRHLAESRT